MNFQQAIDYIHHLTAFGINLGLQRIERVLEILGMPQKRLRFIHIGGTNGKGSTSAMLTSILKESGYKVGTFTSPHLHSYTERIMINSQPISEETFAFGVAVLKPIIEQIKDEQGDCPTEFEVLTALAIWCFYQEQVDIVVWEVGMGGLIDSTNAVTPLVSVLTNVSLDHTNYLGETVKEIAKVKAGIIKETIPVVTSTEDEEALKVFIEEAEKKKSSIYQVRDNFVWKAQKHDLRGQNISIKSKHQDYEMIYLPLIGEHQQVNLATTLMTLEVLAMQGLEISLEAVHVGLSKVKWPGRLEVLSINPPILLDGAHNEAGAFSLQKSLQTLFPGKKLTIVLGVLDDKAREKILEYLLPITQELIITKPPSPRATNWKQLAILAKGKVKKIFVIEELKEALSFALTKQKVDEPIIITGSLYMIGPARELINMGKAEKPEK